MRCCGRERVKARIAHNAPNAKASRVRWRRLSVPSTDLCGCKPVGVATGCVGWKRGSVQRSCSTTRRRVPLRPFRGAAIIAVTSLVNCRASIEVVLSTSPGTKLDGGSFYMLNVTVDTGWCCGRSYRTRGSGPIGHQPPFTSDGAPLDSRLPPVSERYPSRDDGETRGHHDLSEAFSLEVARNRARSEQHGTRGAAPLLKRVRPHRRRRTRIQYSVD